MLSQQLIGNIALNLTTIIYCIWLLPQTYQDYINKNHHTNISTSSNIILIIACILDLEYAIGTHLPSQYLLVDLMILLSLTIAWWQKITKVILELIGITIIFTISLIILENRFIGEKNLILHAYSYLSWLSWLCFLLPQLYKNYQYKTVVGINKLSAQLSLIAGIGDVISCFTLNWPLPSKIGFIIALVPRILLLQQLRSYHK